MFATTGRILVALATIVPLVSAEGIVSLIKTGLNATTGPSPPPAAALDSAIRRVSTFSPTTDVTSAAMTCGPGAQTAKKLFPVQSSGNIQFFWTFADDDGNRLNWNDTIGPLLTYITPCKGACSSFQPGTAPWFKVDQQGLKAGSTSQWVQSDVANNRPPAIDMPNVPNGDYLMRHEIIVLKNATQPGGAQFYVSCSQLTVVGADKKTAGLPMTSLGLTFPGAYSATDPGILVPDLNATDFVYTFPGGDVLTFGSASGSNSSTTTTIAAANATATASGLASNATTATATSNATAITTANAALSTALNADNTTAPVVSGATTADATATTTTRIPKIHTRTTPAVGVPTSVVSTGTDMIPATVTSTGATGADPVAATAAGLSGGDANAEAVTVIVTVTITSTSQGIAAATPTTMKAGKPKVTATTTFTATTTVAATGGAVRRRHHQRRSANH
ncbi:hypothetical protein FRB94_007157 [Tulasnella sp. JGI-2019a]|nr:hypothetical protein FRB93_012477 [Tulasnella sp. JGI-2019a]KAG9011964.1 hypothetical protein FRB94_007157 [Tulasnella sp. JGI-2019a]